LRFSGANNGWLYGDASYRTRDGGRSWVQLALGGPVVALEASRGRAFAVVRASEADVLLSSEAAGSAWVRELETPTAVPAPSLASSDGRAFVLSGSSLVIAGGGLAQRHDAPCTDGDEGRLAVTGSSIWVACRSATGAWSLHHSGDAGASFDPLPDTSAGLDGLDALASRTAGELFTYTAARGLARQRVGGAATVVTRPDASPPVTYVGFSTRQVGFAVPATGGVWRTDDGGATWAVLPISRPGS
jgi:hypothetical protein